MKIPLNNTPSEHRTEVIMNNCMCNIFDNQCIWLIIIALLIIFCCGCNGSSNANGCGCGGCGGCGC